MKNVELYLSDTFDIDGSNTCRPTFLNVHPKYLKFIHTGDFEQATEDFR